jgi:hypothetical protein
VGRQSAGVLIAAAKTVLILGGGVGGLVAARELNLATSRKQIDRLVASLPSGESLQWP